MNYKKNHLLVLPIIFFRGPMVAQQAQFKTVCEDQECVITAYNTDNIYAGYIKLDRCNINYVNVFDEFRKKGFAQALLQQARSQAAAHGCKEVTLFSLKKLINYYQRNGFICNDNQKCTHPI